MSLIEKISILKELQKKAVRIGEQIFNQRQYIKDRLPYCTLMNDWFFTYFMRGQTKCAEELIRTLFKNKTLKVSNITVQDPVNNPGAHGVRFDLIVTTTNNEVINIEVEKNKSRASELRLRFYSSSLDVGLLAKGHKYEELPPIYNVIITAKDFKEQNKPIYYVKRCWVESATKIGDNPELFDDNQTIMYVNGEYRNYEKEPELSALLHDFSCSKIEDMQNEVFKERMRYVKNAQEGLDEMADALEVVLKRNPNFLEELFSETEREKNIAIGEERGEKRGIKKGLEQGREEERLENAKKHVFVSINIGQSRYSIVMYAKKVFNEAEYASKLLDKENYDVPQYDRDDEYVLATADYINNVMQPNNDLDDEIEQKVRYAYIHAITQCTGVKINEQIKPFEVRDMVLGNDCPSIDEIAIDNLIKMYPTGISEQDKDRIVSCIIEYSPLLANTTDNTGQVLNELAKSGIKFLDVPVTPIDEQKVSTKAFFIER